MGRHQFRLLRFALMFHEGWHTYGTDRATVQAVNRLCARGFLEVNEFRQFKIKLGVSK